MRASGEDDSELLKNRMLSKYYSAIRFYINMYYAPAFLVTLPCYRESIGIVYIIIYNTVTEQQIFKTIPLFLNYNILIP